MKKLVPVFLLLFVIGCEYNLGPTTNINNSNTSTNTNTNINDIHDLVNFVPVANPTAPLPAPGGGTDTPLPIPSGAQAIAQQFANANQALLARSCQAIYGESAWAFMDGMVKTLRASDPRWGYVVKSNTGLISQDVIGYRATSDNTGVWAVDIIVAHCETSTFAWNVLGLDANLQWSGTRF